MRKEWTLYSRCGNAVPVSNFGYDFAPMLTANSGYRESEHQEGPGCEESAVRPVCAVDEQGGYLTLFSFLPCLFPRASPFRCSAYVCASHPVYPCYLIPLRCIPWTPSLQMYRYLPVVRQYHVFPYLTPARRLYHIQPSPPHSESSITTPL